MSTHKLTYIPIMHKAVIRLCIENHSQMSRPYFWDRILMLGYKWIQLELLALNSLLLTEWLSWAWATSKIWVLQIGRGAKLFACSYYKRPKTTSNFLCSKYTVQCVYLSYRVWRKWNAYVCPIGFIMSTSILWYVHVRLRRKKTLRVPYGQQQKIPS